MIRLHACVYILYYIICTHTHTFMCNVNIIINVSAIVMRNLDLKNLQSLEICGGGLTDTGVKNIKDLSSLTLLNLSQNSHLTDRALELISGNSGIFRIF